MKCHCGNELPHNRKSNKVMLSSDDTRVIIELSCDQCGGFVWLTYYSPSIQKFNVHAEEK